MKTLRATAVAIATLGTVLLGTVLLGTGAGCSVDDLGLEGKQCPCVEGWVCDAALNVCVSAAGDGSGAGSSSASGSGASGAAAPGVIQPSNLRAEWTTPNVILWRWDREPNEPPDQLAAYELVVGTSEDDVVNRVGSAIVFTSTENPELGRYLLPHTGGDDPVEMTMTDGLQPDTQYFAQLAATDTASGVSLTNVAQARTTLPPTSEIVIFSETPTPGYSLPNNFVHTNGNAFMGSFCYEYDNVLCNPTEDCWENLRRQGLAMDVTSIGTGAFQTTAYFEFAVQNTSAFPAFWSTVWLQFLPNELASFDAMTIRNGPDYRLYQIPLRALRLDGTPIDHSLLANGLDGFNIGSSWEGGAQIRIDELRLRW